MKHETSELIIIATSERAPASELGATLIFGWASCVSDASSILEAFLLVLYIRFFDGIM